MSNPNPPPYNRPPTAAEREADRVGFARALADDGATPATTTDACARCAGDRATVHADNCRVLATIKRIAEPYARQYLGLGRPYPASKESIRAALAGCALPPRDEWMGEIGAAIARLVPEYPEYDRPPVDPIVTAAPVPCTVAPPVTSKQPPAELRALGLKPYAIWSYDLGRYLDIPTTWATGPAAAIRQMAKTRDRGAAFVDRHDRRPSRTTRDLRVVWSDGRGDTGLLRADLQPFPEPERAICGTCEPCRLAKGGVAAGACVGGSL